MNTSKIGRRPLSLTESDLNTIVSRALAAIESDQARAG